MRSVALVFTLLSFRIIAQESSFNPEQTYPPDSLSRWTKSIFNGISEKHPGFYKYTPKKTFDFLIDSTVKTINVPLTELEYYRKLKPLFAKVGCLHTGVSLSKDYQNYLDSTSTLIPIEIFIDEDHRVVVTKNYDTKADIHAGDELLSINYAPIDEILNTLLRAVPSDGYNQTEKLLILNHRFPFWYQTMIEATDKYVVEVIRAGAAKTFELTGTRKETFPMLKSLETNYVKPLEFEAQDATGILKVHSFAKTTIKANGQKFRKFTKATFKQIRRTNIQNLVVDLRYNSGGTDGNAAFLSSYFFDKPFRYWEKIEVTEALSKEIKGFNRLFYKKPRVVDGTYRWRKTWMSNEFDYYLTQKAAKNNFKGKVYILTNGLCMSSCSDFVAILSYNKKAIVIGQESGGGYQGNTSGMIPKAKLPTGLQVSVPLQKYTNAVDLTKNFGQGTIPDFVIQPTFENWMSKADEEMEFVMSMIRQQANVSEK